eukprot:m.4595 g.4595  ORF g.4595 m.4595 type:complete len:174 (-) comp2260_c0_seq1:977-1498(-)
MRNLVEQDRDMNTKTLVELDDQGQKLDRVNRHLQGIHEDATVAEGELTQMEKCCGLCILPWRKRPQQNVGDVEYRSAKERRDRESSNDKARTQTSSQGNGVYVQPILENDGREKEMEENMQVVGSVLKDLKMQALDMADELDKQNDTLDDINRLADVEKDKINSATKRINNLM